MAEKTEGMSHGNAAFADGTRLLREHAYLDAARSFLRAASDDPTNASLLFHLGFAFALAGKSECAATALEVAGQLEPSCRFLYLNVALTVTTTTKNATLGIALLNEVARRRSNGNDAEHQVLLACRAYLSGDFVLAQTHLEYAGEWKPSSPYLESALTLLLLKQGRYADARLRLLRLIGSGQGTAMNTFHLGLAEERLGNVSSARSAYRRALDLEPGLTIAARSLARLQRNTQNEKLWGRTKTFLTYVLRRRRTPVARSRGRRATRYDCGASGTR